MRYEELHPIERSAALRELASGDRHRVSEAMVRIALHDPDRAWVEDLIADHLVADDAWVRGVAALCASHVARIHRALDTARLVPLIERLFDDPDTSGRAQDALDDIAIFAPTSPKP